MSRLQRHGTVTGPSGHTHANSYAMRGVRLKSTVYVPDLLVLPPTWTKPTLPSDHAFSYDYTLENKIADHARQRALSIASEASLQRKQILALQQQQLKQQQQHQESAETLSGVSSATSHSPASSQPHSTLPLLPFMSGTEILTPTPVAPPLSSSNPKVGVVVGINVAGGSSQSNSNSDGSSSSLLSDEDGKKASADSTSDNGKTSNVMKSLGNFSLKEFEGDTTDPFEMAALQAINDMEELQSVLQPSLVGGNSTSTSFSSAPPPSASTLTSTTSHLSSQLGPPPPIAASNFPVLSQPSPPLPVATVSPLNSSLAMPSFSATAGGTTCSSANNLQQVASEPSSTAGSSAKNSNSSPELSKLGTSVLGQPLKFNSRRHSENTVSSAGPSGQIQQQQQQQVLRSTTNPSTVSTYMPVVVSRASSSPVSGNLLSASQSQGSQDSVHNVSYPVIPPSPEMQHLLQEEENSYQASPLQQAWSNPAVSGLVDIASDSSSSRKNPIPTPRKSPKLTAKQGTASGSSSESSSPQLIPRPRPRGGSPIPSGTPPSGSGGIKVLPPPPSPSNSPSLYPKTHSALVTSQTQTTPSNVAPATKGFKTNQGGVATVHPPKPSLASQGGVAVLPPLPSQFQPTAAASTSQPGDIPPPPAYKVVSTPPTTRKGSPPPPYSSPVSNHRAQPVAAALPSYKQLNPPPKVPPKPPYSLPNPEANLSASEKAQVTTIEGAGFPRPRVARAVARFKGDETKVIDFLFLVGELEDAGFNGNSAETALIACEDNTEKAKEYLQKLETYKEFGFHEKSIHEAYSKAKADWDKALNILTKDS